jgi:hypothetical protein
MWKLFKNKMNNEMASVDALSNDNTRLTKRCWLLSILCNLIAISLIFGFYLKNEVTSIQHSSQVSIAREADILSQLNDLKSQLAAVQAMQQQIAQLESNVTHLQQTAATQQSLDNLAKNIDLKQLTDQLAQLRKAIHPGSAPICPISKNHAMHSHTNSLNTILPFKIESLDKIAGQSFASVNYHQRVFPVLLNDSVAGWKAVRMDVNAGVIVLENSQHRRVEITTSRGWYV